MYPPALPGEAAEGSVAVPVDGRESAGTGSGAAGGGGAGGSGAGSSPGDGKGGGGYAGAGYRSGALPHYPSAARRAGREGVVLLRVLVGTDGSAASVGVRETSGYDDFDGAAVQAVRKWRFSPARRAGVAVASFHDVRVRFRLEGVR
jgi:protein TonB